MDDEIPALKGPEQGKVEAGMKDLLQDFRQEMWAAAEQRQKLQETVQNLLHAQQEKDLEEQKCQNKIAAMVQAHPDLLASSVKGAMSGNPAVFCMALFRHQATQNEAMNKRLEDQVAAADASAQEKKRSDEALRLEQAERAIAVAAANSHSAWAHSLDKKLQAAREALEKTKLLADLFESKAQACAAAEAGLQESLEEARNSAVAHEQVIVERQAAQEALAQRIEALERLVESKTQACAAAEAGRLHALERESGSVAVRNKAFQKLKALAAAQNQSALLTQELHDQTKATSHNLESIRRKHAAEVTRLRGSLSSGQAQAKRVAALQHELTAAQEEAAAAREANRQAVTALAEATHREAVAEDRRLKAVALSDRLRGYSTAGSQCDDPQLPTVEAGVQWQQQEDSSSEDEQEVLDMTAAVAASLQTAFPGDVGASTSEVVDCDIAPVEEEVEQSEREGASRAEVVAGNVGPKEEEDAGTSCEMCQAQTHTKLQCPVLRQAQEDLERVHIQKEKALAQRDGGAEPWQQIKPASAKPAKQLEASKERKQQKGQKAGQHGGGVQAPAGRVLTVPRSSGAVRPASLPKSSTPTSSSDPTNPSNPSVQGPQRAPAVRQPLRPALSNRRGMASPLPPGSEVWGWPPASSAPGPRADFDNKPAGA
ncbi:hypothetical protein ABBQ32_006273 [Trebouxia sp. C0010 RCD-2024]